MSEVKLFDDMAKYFLSLQDEITIGLEELEQKQEAYLNPKLEGSAGEPALFKEEEWSTDNPDSPIKEGGGRTRVMENGRIFERAGVNVSNVSGRFKEDMPGMPGVSKDFRASGVSLVLHPRNPNVPTVHANFRIIQRGTERKIERTWFGGGADLTPYILHKDDAIHFHSSWKGVCEEHEKVADYAKMKTDCDEYFFLPHRGESRGVGGIFYDYLDQDLERIASFCVDAGRTFLDSYTPIVKNRCNLNYDEQQKDFQLWRRGRYVEFNLLQDRGTQFGLKTGGRVESILMSLPPLVKWSYNFKPEIGSPEDELLKILKEPISWV